MIDYHENLDDDDDFENDYEDFVGDVLGDHNDIDNHDGIDDNVDDHYGENITLALNVLPCFKERLQFLNIRVKSTTTFTMYTPTVLLSWYSIVRLSFQCHTVYQCKLS